MIELENTEITINREQFLRKCASVITELVDDEDDIRVMLAFSAFSSKLATKLFDEDDEDDEIDEDDTEDNHIHH